MADKGYYELEISMGGESGFVILNVVFRKEGKWVVAECLELGTSTFGRTYDEADKRVREALHLHLQGLEEVGERERFFMEHGVKLYTEYPSEVEGRISPEVFHKAHVISLEETAIPSSEAV